MINYIKISPFLFALVMLLWSGCSSTKKSKTAIPDYIGQWNYVVTGPEGDINGFLKFSQEEDMTIGMIGLTGSDEGESQLSNFTIDEEKVSGNFEYMGYSVSLTGTFEGGVLKGQMTAEGYVFPFDATKQP